MSGDVRGPRVQRFPAAASWEYEHRWGPQVGDTTTYSVSRTDGGSLRIRVSRNESLDIRGDVVAQFAEMVAQAAAWSDEDGTR